ncbi:ogr/Delta-like zinc finger family protein [Xenorhabdus stockiae]|uniref:ogr/Delta-like zinc finger family protein n=1 Tax=Xenorhabdus stockiae TaxID=351614 RepID=UPI003CE695BE
MLRKKSKPLIRSRCSYPPCPLCGSQLRIRTSERMTDTLRVKYFRCSSSNCDFRCSSLEVFETTLNDAHSVPQFSHIPTNFYRADRSSEEC